MLGLRDQEFPRQIAVLVAVVALAAGCATPIGVDRVDARSVRRSLNESVVTTDSPSAPTRVLLGRLGLMSQFEDDPDAVLGKLRGRLTDAYDPDRLFALAELSYLRGEHGGGSPHFLACAVYAYAFLFPEREGEPPDPFDPRLRMAADLYNWGLTEGLRGPERPYLVLQSGRHPLPFGSLDIEFDEAELVWVAHPLKQIEPAAELQLRGLRNRYRRPGIGAPLVSAMSRPIASQADEPDVRRIPPGLKISLTALLRIHQPLEGVLTGHLRGQLELFSVEDDATVEIDGRSVPLEFDTSTSMAASLEGARVYELERVAFLSGSRDVFRELKFEEALLMLHAYEPGRVPVVLVHGTASSPARWMELVNELENDPELSERIAIWLFGYNTGNPIPFSAERLRSALTELVNELDPNGKDPALDDMVVIGHSQGGLVTKMTAISSGDGFWHLIADEPIDEIELSPEARETAETTFFFEPLPFVTRVVYIATPHRGSYLTSIALAGVNPAKLIRGLITLPFDIVSTGVELTQRSSEARLGRAVNRLPTSIDQMTPGDPFLAVLESRPLAEGVTAHSIIAVRGDGPPESGADGVVKYTSAHLEGVASEKVVRSGHSTQALPATIEEVRRIVREHVARGDRARR